MEVEGIPDPRVAGAVSSYFETLSARTEPAWLTLFADDAVIHDPVGSLPAEGRGALAEVWKVLQGPFEKLVLDPLHTFYGGNGAAVKWTGRGRGITGREVEFEGITVFEVNDEGRIHTLMSYWDPAAMLIELAGTD